jgi:2-amino-4-hydroxy-6-hydroxymethyldihydropteridine diphosphokinase
MRPEPGSRVSDSSAYAIVALGSNLGDSPRLIREALRRLEALSAEPIRVSSLWQTTPVDCPPGAPPFVNAVAALLPRPEETPETLLDKLQALETALGRVPKRVHNEPRVIDLDLIAFGVQTRATPRLILPHARACQRRFVLEPLSEIAPDLVLPGQEAPVARLLDRLNTGEALTKIG